MKRFITYPSIEQFRNVVTNILRVARFDGLDENGDPILNLKASLPTLEFQGTEKVHGSNAGVCWNTEDGLWAQSRKNIITPEKDNAGFATFVYKNSEIFESFMIKIKEQHNLSEANNISIYGEWAGGNIQKNSACDGLDKSLYIFGVKISPFDLDDEGAYWVSEDEPYLNAPEANIFNINNFPKYSITVDFNEPLLSQNKMIEMVSEVEKCSPVGKFFGKENIGEGIVFKCNYKDVNYRFKVKGDKHSVSKVKTLKKVDDEKLNKIIETVNKVVPAWRLEQMYAETFDTINGGKGEIKRTGDFLRAVIKDVMKEELDVIVAAGLEPKEINKKISVVARTWFMEQLDKESGLS